MSKSYSDVLSKYPWSDGFLKEFHGLSPSYIARSAKDGRLYTHFPDSLPAFRALFAFDDEDSSSLEIIFIGVRFLDLSFQTDLEVSMKYIDGWYDFKLCDDSRAGVSCRDIWVNQKSVDFWGNGPQYGYEEYFDSGGDCILR